jgi:hypothetical protein
MYLRRRLLRIEESMKATFALLVAGIVVLAADVPTIAHHSFAAEFDATKSIKVTGPITKIEWMNPHAYFYLDATELCEGGAGTAEQAPDWKCGSATQKNPKWGMEMGSPNGLMRQGWTRASMKVGDVVTVEGSRAKDGAQIGNARSVMLSGGKRLFAASSQGANP